MASISFVSKSTVVPASWLQAVNDFLYITFPLFATTVGASMIGFIQSGTGMKNNTVEAKLRDSELSLNDVTGADPTGVADSYAAFVAAYAAAQPGDTIKIKGHYRVSAAITLASKNITIEGIDCRTGNVPDGNLSQSSIYFYNDTNGFVTNTWSVTFKNVLILGLPETSSNNDGIKVTGGTLKLVDSVVQGFLVGTRLLNTHYSKFLNSTIVGNRVCLIAGDGTTACRNVMASGMTFQASSSGGDATGIQMNAGSDITLSGGSIENFGGSGGNGFGLFLLDQASAVVLGTYFEGTGVLGTNMMAGQYTSLTTLGVRAQLTNCARHISRFGSEIGQRVFSRNSRFAYPTTAQAVAVYNFGRTDAALVLDVAGDNYSNGGVAPGAGVSYAPLGGGGGMGTGQIRIEYPYGHPLYLSNENTIPTGTGTLPTASGTTVAEMVTAINALKTAIAAKIGG